MKILNTIILIITTTIAIPAIGKACPLNGGVRMEASTNYKNALDGIVYVLSATDYRISVTNQTRGILSAPIPPGAFDGRVIPVSEALLMLIGSDNRVVVDTKNHLIAFEPNNIKPI